MWFQIGSMPYLVENSIVMEDRINGNMNRCFMDGKKVQHTTGILTEKQTTIIEFNKPLRSEDHPRSQWTCLPI
jgi:hypothetical protein